MVIEFFRSHLEETNSTIPDLNNSQSSQIQITVYSVMMPLLGLIAIIMNLSVVISSGFILRHGQEPRTTYMFLGNVALTDMITSFAIIFGQFFPRSMRNHQICALQIGLIVASTMTSVYSVGLIAIDRFLYIVHGFKYRKYINPTKARCLIAFSWLIGGTIGFLPLMGWSGETDNGRVCWFIIIAPKPLILLTSAIGCVPILTVVVLYMIILYHAIKNVERMRNTKEDGEITAKGSTLRAFRGGSSANSSTFERERGAITLGRSPTKWKAVKVVLFTTGSFAVTWFPYFVACVTYAYCGERKSELCKSLSVLIAVPLAILGFCNSLIDPLIYAWWHKGFRSFVRKKLNGVLAARRDRRRTVDSRATVTSKTSRTSSRKISSCDGRSVERF